MVNYNTLSETALPTDLTTLAILAAAFLCISAAHTSVGLGGGSSYTAIMAICGLSVAVIPTISLSLNLIATSIGAITFIRHRHARWKLILPFLILSLPAAYLGGKTVLPKTIFYLLLLVSLIVITIQLLRTSSKKNPPSIQLGESAKFILSLLIGGALGFLAGALGIGGGIYLVPLIIVLGIGSEKEAATCGTMFIFFNSATGLAARLQHSELPWKFTTALAASVVIGSLIGSTAGASKLPPTTVRRTLACVISLACVLLAKKIADSQHLAINNTTVSAHNTKSFIINRSEGNERGMLSGYTQDNCRRVTSCTAASAYISMSTRHLLMLTTLTKSQKTITNNRPGNLSQ